MTTTRFLFILFLLLNILFFSASRDWFGLGSPGELSNTPLSVYPDRIKILGHTPPPEISRDENLPPIPPEQEVCLAWSGLSVTQNSKLISLFSAAGIQAAVREVQVMSSWRVVRAQPLPTFESAEILVDNMVELGVKKDTIQIEEIGERKFLIVLGETFREKRAADRHLDAMKARGIDAAIEPRNAPERQVEATVSVKKAETLLEGQSFGKRHKPCSQ